MFLFCSRQGVPGFVLEPGTVGKLGTDTRLCYVWVMSDHHQLTIFIPILGIFAAMCGAAIAIFAGIHSAKRASAKRFDFAESARRIRGGHPRVGFGA